VKVKVKFQTAHEGYKAGRVYGVDPDAAAELISSGVATPFREQQAGAEMRVVRAAETAVATPTDEETDGTTGQPS